MGKKLLVVLDTNVFVSGILSSKGVPGAILQHFKQREFDVVVSKAQIREILDVLQRPHLRKFLPGSTLKEVVSFLLKFKKICQVIVGVPKLSWNFQDAKDYFLLDLSAHIDADYLVTGDKRLRALAVIKDTVIITPAEFLVELSAGKK